MFLVYIVCFLSTCFPVSQQQTSSMEVNPTITQFSLAKNSVGLLAHSYQEGEHFMQLDVGDTILINNRSNYRVVEIQRYYRDHPVTVYQGGIDLATGEHYTAGEIFGRTYGKDGYLVLQTCIETPTDNQWGLIFFLAKPVVGNYYIPQ